LTHYPREPDRRSLLVAVLGFALLEGHAPELALVRAWLGTCKGSASSLPALARQGYDLALARYSERGWRAKFYASGVEHSPTGATGSAFQPLETGISRATAYRAITDFLRHRQMLREKGRA